MRTYTNHSLIYRQKGAALLIFFMALFLAGVTFLITIIPNNNHQLKRQQQTTLALAQAKKALIAYAVSNYYRSNPTTGTSLQGWHGYLPCVEGTNADPGNEGRQLGTGSCPSQRINALGRLPWKSLSIDPLKDSSGQCLWYAVSFSYTQSSDLLHNADSPGMFDIYDTSGNKINSDSPEDRIVAVVFAPGAQLPTQNRASAVDGYPCGQPRNLVQAADFLDSISGINNASISGLTDQIDSFAGIDAGISNAAFNDRIITISRKEIFDAILKQTDRATGRPLLTVQLEQLGMDLGNCLVEYAKIANDQLISDNANPSAIETSCLNDDPLQYPTCTSDFNSCINADLLTDGECNANYMQCRHAARSLCMPGYYDKYLRFPWPAAIDLNDPLRTDDFRNKANYTDVLNSPSLFGHFPYIASNSNLKLGINPATVFYNCNFTDNATGPGANPNLRLWNDWKDQIFFVAGGEFSAKLDNTITTPLSANTPACNTDCPQILNSVSGLLERHAALIIISNIALDPAPGTPTAASLNQLRRDNDIEPAAQNFSDQKGNITNYLELNNALNANDLNGNLQYSNPLSPYNNPPPAVLPANINDIVICIDEDMFQAGTVVSVCQ